MCAYLDMYLLYKYAAPKRWSKYPTDLIQKKRMSQYTAAVKQFQQMETFK